MAGARADDAAQLDRQERGRAGHVHDRGDRRHGRSVHDAPGHAVGRHVLRVLGRASAGEAAGGAGRHVERRRAAGREGPKHPSDVPRAGRYDGGRRPRRACGQPGERRADPVFRRALRADGVRHGGDHGRARARRAGLRVRQVARRADPRRDPARGGDRRCGSDDGRLSRRGGHGELGAVRRRARRPRPIAKVAAWLARGGARRAGHHVPAARLVAEPPALLGRADPDHPLPVVRRGGGSRR